ncbi:MAG: glycosyltransferase family 2 protein [Elainellaceae cyanobacterium]
MPGSSKTSDLSQHIDNATANPFESGLAGRRRKAAVTLTAVWSGTVVLHLVPGGSWIVVGLTALVGMHLVRTMFTRPRIEPEPLTEHAVHYPYVSLLVAAKNEEAVIANLIKNLCTLDYPDDHYDVWLIDDSSTDQTPAILERLGQVYPNLNVVHRSAEAGGGKSGALNQVWPLTQADIMAVFDADALVPDDLLRRVVPLFDQTEVGAVQVRKAIANASANFWTRAQAGEMILDSYIQEKRIAVGGIGELRGNGQFVRRDAIEDCHGWNEETITDDLDLTLRLHLNRWTVLHLSSSAVEEEGVTGVVGLWHQRSRWAEGGYQRYLDYWRLIAQNRLGTRKTLDMLAFWTIQYLVPTAALPDLLMAIARNRLPVLSLLTTIATGFSLVSVTLGQWRLHQSESMTDVVESETTLATALPVTISQRSAASPTQRLITTAAILFRSLRTTLYMLHWMLVIASTSIRISIRPKRLKWVKTVHHGSGETGDGSVLIDV